MTTKNHGQGNGDENNPSVGYDKSDLSARGIIIFFLVLAVCTIALNFSVLAMYFGMTKFAEKHDPEVSPMAPQGVTPRSGMMTNTANVNLQKFPEPRLQTNDAGDMTKFLVKETATLTAQSFQDAQGNVHLPIDEAMKVVGAQLPVRTGSVALPNYPGAKREYSYPSAPDSAAEQRDETGHSEVQNSPATIPRAQQ